MPVYNHYYPDRNNQINTPESSLRLLTEGPTVPVLVGLTQAHVSVLQRLGRPVPPPVAGYALIDTGATFCAVDDGIIRQLGVSPVGYQQVLGATGGHPSVHPSYPASLSFPGTNLPNITFLDFIGLPIAGSGIVAMIGRSVLKDFVLVFNGPGGYVTLAY